MTMEEHIMRTFEVLGKDIRVSFSPHGTEVCCAIVRPGEHGVLGSGVGSPVSALVTARVAAVRREHPEG